MSNIIESLITDIRHHEQSLLDRLAENKREEARLRKLLQEVRRHRKRLERDHPGGEAVLPPEEAEELDDEEEPEPRPSYYGEPTPENELPEEPDNTVSWEDSKDAADQAEASLMIEEAKAKARTSERHRRKAKADPTLGGTAPFRPLSRATTEE